MSLFNTKDGELFTGVFADMGKAIALDSPIHKAQKGTPQYEEWLRKYREKRGKKVDTASAAEAKEVLEKTEVRKQVDSLLSDSLAVPGEKLSQEQIMDRVKEMAGYYDDSLIGKDIIKFDSVSELGTSHNYANEKLKRFSDKTILNMDRFKDVHFYPRSKGPEVNAATLHKNNEELFLIASKEKDLFTNRTYYELTAGDYESTKRFKTPEDMLKFIHSEEFGKWSYKSHKKAMDNEAKNALSDINNFAARKTICQDPVLNRVYSYPIDSMSKIKDVPMTTDQRKEYDKLMNTMNSYIGVELSVESSTSLGCAKFVADLTGRKFDYPQLTMEQAREYAKEGK